MSVCGDFPLSPNNLLSSFDTSLDDDLSFELSKMVDNNDPWIGNGIVDNMFGGQMFDEDINTGQRRYLTFAS